MKTIALAALLSFPAVAADPGSPCEHWVEHFAIGDLNVRGTPQRVLDLEIRVGASNALEVGVALDLREITAQLGDDGEPHLRIVERRALVPATPSGSDTYRFRYTFERQGDDARFEEIRGFTVYATFAREQGAERVWLQDFAGGAFTLESAVASTPVTRRSIGEGVMRSATSGAPIFERKRACAE